jgi:hypothetical protein
MIKQNKKIKLVIYTTLLGDKEALGSPLSDIQDTSTDLDISFVCFTDSHKLESETWELKSINMYLLSADKMCRQAKALPHEFFPEHQYSLWIDNIVKLKRLPTSADLQTTNKFLFKLFVHSGRSNLFEEACAIHGLGYETSETVLNQMEHYSKFVNLSSVSPLSTTTVIVREHHHPSVIEFGKTWWSHILNFSKRDQLSFDFVRTQLNTEIDYFPGTKLDNDLVYPQENFSSSRVLANFDERKYSYLHQIPQAQSGTAKEAYFNSQPDMQRSNLYARRNSVFSLILNLSNSGMTARFSPRRGLDLFLDSKLSPFVNFTTNTLQISNNAIIESSFFFNDEEIRNFIKGYNIYLAKTNLTHVLQSSGSINSKLVNPTISFDIALLFNFNSVDIVNLLSSVYSSMNPNKGLIIFFSYEHLDPGVILNLSNKIQKDFHISFTGYFNDIKNQYIDNSIICFSW